MAGWRPGSLSEGRPCPVHCPRGLWRPRAPHQRVTRAHYAIPAPHGPLSYRGRLARCPGYPLSDTHRSQPRSQPVNRAPAPLQNWFEPTFPPTAKRPPFCQFNEPTNSHYTDPGVPWVGITPPPNHSSHHAFHITPYTQTRWPHSLNMYVFPLHIT